MMQVCAQARRDCVCHPHDSRRDFPHCTTHARRQEARRDVHKTIRTWLD